MPISETALFLSNPELAQAMRRQRLAEMFLRGTQQEDIKHPLQGVASVANKLLGAYLMRGSLDEGDAAQAKAQEERAWFRGEVDKATGGAGFGGPLGRPIPSQPQASMPAPQQAQANVPADLMPHIQEASQRTGIPAPVLMAQMRQESGGNPQAVGDGGQSIGPMQVQQRTAMQPGYGLAPIDPATLKDPRVNINFGADYLAARGKAAGVQDWNDPAQRAKGLAAYNGGGDPNYVANVERYMPAAGGTNQPATVAQASATSIPTSNVEAEIARAQNLQRIGLAGSRSSDPNTRHEADMLFRMGQQAEARAMQSQARLDALANRNMQTVTLASPDGVARVHEMTPQGPGRVIGTAPQQQQMHTVQMQDPDGGMGIYEVTPQGVGRRLGSAQDARIGQDFDRANTLRDEFGRLTSDFRVVQTAYENIRSAAASQSGAGDMSMLYSYVKLLDPTSVVRESEFATAAASGSFGERVQGAAQRIISGERLPDTLRDSFLKEARSIYGNQRRSHDAIADQYETLAKRFNIDPAKVVTRFTRSQEDAVAPFGQTTTPGEFVEQRPGVLPGTSPSFAPRGSQALPPIPPGWQRVQ